MPNSALGLALNALRRKFPDKSDDWIKRVLARLKDVEERRRGEGGASSDGADFYIVKGRPDLGDKQPIYHVWWSQEERRWYCTCYLTGWGQKRAKEICTHAAAVMLYRQYKGMVDGLEDKRVYVASAVVECPSKPGANGEVYAAPFPGKTLTEYAQPRWRVVAISASPVVEIYCGKRPVLKIPGEEMDYAAAKVLAEEAIHS
jgi:hypothetical protein|nr:MAG: hypothetical protein TU35_06470 [Thermoproteus sp. AZ2]